ncbi:MAG: hypothetical protein M3313_06960 [Actinomycetota bacterium]|nr:hypothetical protein [Actinomycetota bacterium]
MQWITIATPPFPSIEQFDKVTETVDAAPPEGMEGRYIGTTHDGKLRVVTLWTTKAHADQFFANARSGAGQGPRPRAGGTARGVRDRRRPQLRTRVGQLRPHSRLCVRPDLTSF